MDGRERDPPRFPLQPRDCLGSIKAGEAPPAGLLSDAPSLRTEGGSLSPWWASSEGTPARPSSPPLPSPPSVSHAVL